jgi:hypothetical protein
MALLQFRGIGGIYLVEVQVTTQDEYTCANNFLYDYITAAVGHSRVYDRWVPETVSINAGTEFITYVYDHADPDRYTHGSGATQTRIVPLYFEVLVWKQGTNYINITSTATTLRGALNVVSLDRVDGHINGCCRHQFRAGQHSMEG